MKKLFLCCHSCSFTVIPYVTMQCSRGKKNFFFIVNSTCLTKMLPTITSHFQLVLGIIFCFLRMLFFPLGPNKFIIIIIGMISTANTKRESKGTYCRRYCVCVCHNIEKIWVSLGLFLIVMTPRFFFKTFNAF